MRSKKLLICLVFLFVSLFAFGFNAKVKAIETSELIKVEGAQVRTTGNAGIRFVATEAYEGENETYGILLAFGEAEADENFVVGGTVNGKEVANAEIATAEGTFAATLYDIPEVYYTQTISARAYVKAGETYVYSSTVCVKSLAEVALKAKADGDESDLVAAAVAATANYKKTWIDSQGRVFVGSATYESDYEKLAQMLINDWNAKFGTELDENAFLGGTQSPWYLSAKSSKQSDWSNAKLKEFFQDAEMGPKWMWLLEMMSDYATNDFAKAQYLAIKNNVADSGNWYFGAHLSSSVMSFLTGSTQSAGYGGYNFTNNTSQALSKFDQYNTTVYADLSNSKLVKTTESITVPAIAAKDGYTATYVGAESATFAENALISAANSFVIEIQYTTVTYTITLMWEDMEVNTVSYTIENGVTLDPIELPGYLFEGWYDNENLEGDPVTSVAKGNLGNKVYYAKMTESEYNEVTVTFDSNWYFSSWEDLTNALLADINEACGSNFTKESYFAQSKWTTNETGLNKFITDEKYSYWKAMADYLLEYETNSYHKAAITNFKNGVANSGSQTPYAFAYITRAIVSSTVHNSNASFVTADYSNVDAQNTILSLVKGPGATATYITPATITETLTRPGYTFAGWYTNAECTGEAVTEYPGFSGDTRAVTYYAKWVKAE